MISGDSLSIINRSVQWLRTTRVQRLFFYSCLAVVLATTVYWSVQAARIHMDNADQLANTYLMRDLGDAGLPGAHTFLFKLPLFWLNSVLGATTTSYIVLTVLVSLLTVGGLIYMMTRFERRAVPGGVMLLVLALVLLYIPAQVAPGTLLPLNIAMLTTRNLEYILFMVAMYWLLQYPHIRRVQWWGAAMMLGLVAASDKLFLVLTIGVAGIYAAYALLLRRQALQRAVSMVVAGGVAVVVMYGLLLGIQAMGLRIVDSGAASPYALSVSMKGIFYSVVHIFTNFGANPVYDYGLRAGFLQVMLTRLTSPTGIGMVMTLLCSMAVGWATWRLAVDRHRSLPGRPLVGVLLCASLVSMVAFVATDHAYVIDARYLGIVFFAGMISLSVWLPTVKLPLKVWYISAVMLLIGCGLGAMWTHQVTRASLTAQRALADRNQFVATALKQYNIPTIMGDYWRVYPIAQRVGGEQKVVALSSCTQQREVLAPKAGVPGHSPFALLLSSDESAADFPACTIEAAKSRYGEPSRTLLVAGTDADPKEYLLLYTHGTHHHKPAARSIPARKSPDCSQGTLMTFVAHQDDDILFMQPDEFAKVDSGMCLYSVYLTAGDAAQDKGYWLKRQFGAEAAHAELARMPNRWDQTRVELAPGMFASVSTLRGSNRVVSLIFLNLPDGNQTGRGFASTRYQSLQRLYSGEIPTMTTVDGASTYTKQQLTELLAGLVERYAVTEVWSQAYTGNLRKHTDHSDHLAAGSFVREAMKSIKDVPVYYYYGYTNMARPENVSGDDLQRKYRVFNAYNQFDEGTCKSLEGCDQRSVYGGHLRRQYRAE